MTVETPKTPADLAREAAETAQRALADLRQSASMSALVTAMADLDALLTGLDSDIRDLRTRGYVFKGYLERKTQVLAEQWRTARPGAEAAVQAVSRDLYREADGLDAEFRGIQDTLYADPVRSCERLEALKRAVELAANKVTNEQAKIRAQFSNLAENAAQTKRQVDDSRDCLKSVAEASFKLYPTESPIDAVKAQWLQDGKNGPKGILFVTDARLLFEQREDVAKEKVLFLTTKKERVQKLLIDAPIGSAQKTVESESGALLWHKELLDIAFAEGQSLRQAQFKLDEDSATWSALINRVVTGDIDQERTGPKAAAAPTKPAPTKCPTCTANLDTPIVKGMQSFKCPYCGTVIPLT